jgi:hypothetical protein
MKNKLVLEWDMPAGTQSEAVREALLKAVTQCVRVQVGSFRCLTQPESIFIHTEHEEVVTVSSLAELAYEKP